MTRFVRYLLLVVCAAQFFFAVAFFLQLPIAVNVWPYAGTDTPDVHLYFVDLCRRCCINAVGCGY